MHSGQTDALWAVSNEYIMRSFQNSWDPQAAWSVMLLLCILSHTLEHGNGQVSGKAPRHI